VDGGLLQIEGLRNQAEQFQSQLICLNLFGPERFLDPLGQKLAQLALGHAAVRNGMLLGKARNLRERFDDRAYLAKSRVVACFLASANKKGKREEGQDGR